MKLSNSRTYRLDLEKATGSVTDLHELKGSSILITGATGLIGSYITEMLLTYNRLEDAGIRIYACGRSLERLKDRFDDVKTELLCYVEHDVNREPAFDFDVDYIIHAASNAYPAAFNQDPVGTIMSNVLGTKYLLDYGMNHGTRRLLYVSSGEVYGRGDLSLDSFREDYGGYVDPVQPRSCYPNGKRTAETLCVSYTQQYGLDTVIVRPCHTYGPNATKTDNRANVQFISKAANGEDIVMKSAGTQMRSYAYIADSAAAILTVLLKGESCHAYNIANPKARCTIAEYAACAAEQAGVKIVFENPDEVAIAQRSPIEKQVLNTECLEALGWKGEYSVEKGIAHTLEVLKEIEE